MPVSTEAVLEEKDQTWFEQQYHLKKTFSKSLAFKDYFWI